VDSKTKDQTADGKSGTKNGFRNGKQQQCKGQATSSNSSLNSDSAVPMLQFGAANNFDQFKRKLLIPCLEKYKNLGRLINDKDYYEPAVIDTVLYNLTNDPFEIEKGRLREAHKRRDKEIDDMRIDGTSMFACIVSKLSKKRYDEVQVTRTVQNSKLAETL
jgi:hypothetical protein